MTQQPHAIETQYRGYRFRSRLEARWAVWLDTLGVEYEYEAEGFDLGGTRYLPDFRIENGYAFVEVKPKRSLLPDDLRKASLLALQGRARVVVISGDPWPGEYEVRCFTQFGLECHAHDSHRVAAGSFHHVICRVTDDDASCEADFHSLNVTEFLAGDGVHHRESRTVFIAVLPETASLSAAYRTARGARFEFGEHGR
jgi:hypothetical protein